jgi:hypothetical protein
MNRLTFYLVCLLALVFMGYNLVKAGIEIQEKTNSNQQTILNLTR